VANSFTFFNSSIVIFLVLSVVCSWSHALINVSCILHKNNCTPKGGIKIFCVGLNLRK
jgi:hypothetical protein